MVWPSGLILFSIRSPLSFSSPLIRVSPCNSTPSSSFFEDVPRRCLVQGQCRPPRTRCACSCLHHAPFSPASNHASGLPLDRVSKASAHDPHQEGPRQWPRFPSSSLHDRDTHCDGRRGNAFASVLRHPTFISFLGKTIHEVSFFFCLPALPDRWILTFRDFTNLFV